MQPLLLKDLQEVPAVVAGWRAPYAFGVKPDLRPFRPGMTIAEIVREHPGLPANFMKRGTVTLNGHELSREHWHRIRPKVYSDAQPHILHLSIAPQGGQKGGGVVKSIIGVVALIALTIATAGIASAGIGAGMFAGQGAGIAGGWFAAGTISAKILAAGVGLIGALAIAALTRPPTTTKKDEGSGDGREAAGATGNVLEPNGPIPRVVGTRKIYPPMACEPRVELVGNDEFVEAVYILCGPHQITDIKLGDAPIEDDEAVEYTTREGWADDEPQTFITKVGRTANLNLELKTHKTSGSAALSNQTNPMDSIPKPQRFVARRSPDEIAIHIMFPAGLAHTSSTMVAPMRLRFREVGSPTWINAPEIHFRGSNKQEQLRAQILIKWDADSTALTATASGTGWHYARTTIPPQNVLTPTDSGNQWDADAHFYSGSGDVYISDTNLATSGLQNIAFTSNGAGLSSGSGNSIGNAGTYINCAEIYLDSATFPKGMYEFELLQGEAYNRGNFTPASYIFSGNVCNFFKFYISASTPRVHQDPANVVSTCAISRCISIWYETPTPMRGFAYILIRGKNKSLQQLSCIASGWVRDWDGTGWNEWVVTDNPAPHFVDTLIGNLNRDPIDPADLDNDELVEWRARNVTDGRRCNAIIENMRNDEARDLIAGCGRARSYQSEVWGVVQDYDRSAELPVCTFSARNARSFSFEKAFTDLPDGLLATYVDEDNDYAKDQVTIPRIGDALAITARVEQVAYEGLVTEAEVTERAQFDLLQGEYRSTFYYLEAPPEQIRCRRGSLVAVQHDVLERWCGAARIKSVNLVSTDIVSIVLDAQIEIKTADGMESATDMLAVTDVLELGIVMGCSIRRTDGTISIHELSNGPGFTDTLVFATSTPNTMVPAGPFDSTPIPAIDVECLVTVGPLGSEYTRMLVWDIAPGQDLTARLTLVDEAPELWD